MSRSNDTYFNQSDFVSNSELKSLKAELHGIEPIPNLQAIFDFGHLCEEVVLDGLHGTFRQKEWLDNPANEKDLNLAMQMRETFMKDSFCRSLLEIKGKREYEFYRKRDMIVPGRCRADKWIPSMNLMLEFKGLAITTQNAFDTAIYHFDYDQAAAWYMDISGADRYILIACSKKKPKMLFKKAITRETEFYKVGKAKYEKYANLWRLMFVK